MRKKFLVCILLPCCILIAACGHTADTKNDLLSENITSDTETDTQTSDYEKYNNYGSTEEQMDGYVRSFYSYKNDDNSTAIITYHDGKLYSKCQNNLDR